MSTPIEDRVTALETLTAQQTELIGQLASAGKTMAQRLTALESQYADAVVRYQKADRLMNRLITIIRTMTLAVAPQMARYFDRLPEDDRIVASKQWEKVTSGGRFDPDNGA